MSEAPHEVALPLMGLSLYVPSHILRTLTVCTRKCHPTQVGDSHFESSRIN